MFASRDAGPGSPARFSGANMNPTSTVRIGHLEAICYSDIPFGPGKPAHAHAKFFSRNPKEAREFVELQELRRRFATITGDYGIMQIERETAKPFPLMQST